MKCKDLGDTMPFIAIDSGNENKRVDITQFEGESLYALKERGQFVCQDCGVPMEVAAIDSVYMSPHFRHSRGDDRYCHYRDGGGESEIHRQGKRLVKQELLALPAYEGFTAELEYLVETDKGRRFIDVAMIHPDGRKEAHEIQLAQQATDRFNERTEAYRSVDFDTVWWIGNAADTATNRAWLRDNCNAYGIVGIETYTDEILNKRYPRRKTDAIASETRAA